jgi:hypothetical protein
VSICISDIHISNVIRLTLYLNLCVDTLLPTCINIPGTSAIISAERRSQSIEALLHLLTAENLLHYYTAVTKVVQLTKSELYFLCIVKMFYTYSTSNNSSTGTTYRDDIKKHLEKVKESYYKVILICIACNIDYERILSIYNITTTTIIKVPASYRHIKFSTNVQLELLELFKDNSNMSSGAIGTMSDIYSSISGSTGGVYDEQFVNEIVTTISTMDTSNMLPTILSLSTMLVYISAYIHATTAQSLPLCRYITDVTSTIRMYTDTFLTSTTSTASNTCMYTILNALYTVLALQARLLRVEVEVIAGPERWLEMVWRQFWESIATNSAGSKKEKVEQLYTRSEQFISIVNSTTHANIDFVDFVLPEIEDMVMKVSTTTGTSVGGVCGSNGPLDLYVYTINKVLHTAATHTISSTSNNVTEKRCNDLLVVCYVCYIVNNILTLLPPDNDACSTNSSNSGNGISSEYMKMVEAYRQCYRASSTSIINTAVLDMNKLISSLLAAVQDNANTSTNSSTINAMTKWIVLLMDVISINIVNTNNRMTNSAGIVTAIAQMKEEMRDRVFIAANTCSNLNIASGSTTTVFSRYYNSYITGTPIANSDSTAVVAGYNMQPISLANISSAVSIYLDIDNLREVASLLFSSLPVYVHVLLAVHGSNYVGDVIGQLEMMRVSIIDSIHKICSSISGTSSNNSASDMELEQVRIIYPFVCYDIVDY